MRQRLGQHFLSGTWAARALIGACSVRTGDYVLEIGPGKGALTKELLKTGANVVAVEKDESLIATLGVMFSAEIRTGQLTLVSADIRDIDLSKLGFRRGEYVLAANIPYYITGEILRQFLTATIQPRAIALLVQKEVAQRITSTKESILSLSVKAYGTSTIVAKVSKGNFNPPPKVDSAILLIEHVSREFFKDVDEKVFFAVIHAGFSSKRKLLAGNLARQFGDSARSILEKCSIAPNARAEEVPLEKWKCIAQTLEATANDRASL